MGGPSAAIVLQELAELGVRRAVRVGTCGALDPGLEHGDSGRRRRGPGGGWSEPRPRCRREPPSPIRELTARLAAGLPGEVAPRVHRDDRSLLRRGARTRAGRPARARMPGAGAVQSPSRWRRPRCSRSAAASASPPPACWSSRTPSATGAGSRIEDDDLAEAVGAPGRPGRRRPQPRVEGPGRGASRSRRAPPARGSPRSSWSSTVLEALRDRAQAAGEAVDVVAGRQVQVPDRAGARLRGALPRAERHLQGLLHPGVVDQQLGEVAQRALAPRGRCDPVCLRRRSRPYRSRTVPRRIALERGYWVRMERTHCLPFQSIWFWHVFGVRGDGSPLQRNGRVSSVRRACGCGEVATGRPTGFRGQDRLAK